MALSSSESNELEKTIKELGENEEKFHLFFLSTYPSLGITDFARFATETPGPCTSFFTAVNLTQSFAGLASFSSIGDLS